MNTEVVFIIIVVFLVADFIVERILEWVNMRAMAPVLPENLKGIYDEKEYARFQNYKRETNRFDLISSTFSFIVMMVFLCTGGFGWWNGQIRRFYRPYFLCWACRWFPGYSVCLSIGMLLFILKKNMVSTKRQ